MIYAVDFDGTLCTEKFPKIGEPNIPLINFLISEQAKGNKLILYTMREGASLVNAVIWCEDHGLHFDMVNENLPETIRGHISPRKVYADVYIDDHNARYGVCANLPFTGGNHAEK